MSPLLLAAATAATLALTPPASAAPAHQHGQGRLSVVVDGPALVIELELPQDALVGFERPPRTVAEQQAAAAALARLKDGASLFAADAAAQCQLVQAQVQAPVLEGRGPAVGGHADADVSYEFRCAEPAKLQQLEQRLFDTFRRLERLQVQRVGPAGQRQLTLKRPARSVPLKP